MAGNVKLLTSAGGGVVLDTATTTASDVTVKVPAQNCTLGIQGPAFSAYMTANQTVSSGVFTKFAFSSERFDTNNCYDTTSYRFTPNVAGYYQFSAGVGLNTNPVTGGMLTAVIYKNGALDTYVCGQIGSGYSQNGAALLYMNGTTDYVELYGYVSGTALTWNGTSSGVRTCYFEGTLVRAA